jgi:hypothetical protein
MEEVRLTEKSRLENRKHYSKRTALQVRMLKFLKEYGWDQGTSEFLMSMLPTT